MRGYSVSGGAAPACVPKPYTALHLLASTGRDASGDTCSNTSWGTFCVRTFGELMRPATHPPALDAAAPRSDQHLAASRMT